MAKYYTSKYALTKGIEEHDVDEDACWRGCFTANGRFYLIGVNAFPSRAEAAAHARTLLTSKRKSLRKQLARLSTLKF